MSIHIESSLALPLLTAEVATQFVEVSAELTHPAWLRRVRAWVQQQRTT